MIKALKALLLGAALCTSVAKAFDTDYIGIGLGGAASGWGLAHAWKIMEKEGIRTPVRVPLTLLGAVVAYTIRTQLFNIAPGSDADAIGLLAAIASFFLTLDALQDERAVTLGNQK